MDDVHRCHGNVEAMQFERRMSNLLLLLALLGAPALGLRLLCAGHSCDEPASSSAKIPFCSLPREARTLIGNGFREGRSPNVLAFARQPVSGGTSFAEHRLQPEWPSRAAVASTRVPIAFHIPGVDDAGRGSLASGTGLDDIAPTIAALIELQRPHPEVRSGRPLAEVATGSDIPLVIEIVWKGVGSEDLEADPEAWPRARALVEDLGTMDGRTGSLPLDPAAILTTIGTGGTPEQHGVIGSLLRDESGALRQAWSRRAPVSVIAALGDDLDEVRGQRARIGMVAHDRADRGLIGGNWYVSGDEDDFLVSRGAAGAAQEVARLLDDGYGRDAVPDLLAVTLQGSIAEMDGTTRRILRLAERKLGPGAFALAFAAAGAMSPSGALQAKAVTREVEKRLPTRRDVVAASAPGGLFLDQKVIASERIEDEDVLDALERVEDTSGARVFHDVFPAIAVSFGRYC